MSESSTDIMAKKRIAAATSTTATRTDLLVGTASSRYLTIDITIDGPKALAKLWVAKTLYYELRPNWDLQEISCSETSWNFPAFEK